MSHSTIVDGIIAENAAAIDEVDARIADLVETRQQINDEIRELRAARVGLIAAHRHHTRKLETGGAS